MGMATIAAVRAGGFPSVPHGIRCQRYLPGGASCYAVRRLRGLVRWLAGHGISPACRDRARLVPGVAPSIGRVGPTWAAQRAEQALTAAL